MKHILYSTLGTVACLMGTMFILFRYDVSGFIMDHPVATTIVVWCACIPFSVLCFAEANVHEWRRLKKVVKKIFL